MSIKDKQPKPKKQPDEGESHCDIPDDTESMGRTVDARGLDCPMPLLKAKLALNAMEVGEFLRVLATDKGSVRDFHAYAELSGHILQHFEQKDAIYEYIIEKTH